MLPDYYNTIGNNSVAEFKDRGSRFIGYAFPVQTTDDFKKHLAALKKEHPKAVHHCFAYRLGIDKNNFRVSDDGEPSGSAGRPILGQIDSKELTNVLVVVVRYFGGTLLGVPGLINAYKTATALALQNSVFITKPVCVNYTFEFGYELMNDVMRLVKKYECEVLNKKEELFCLLELAIPKNNLDLMIQTIQNLRGVEYRKV